MSNYSIQMKAAFVECLSRAVPLHNVIILNGSAFILDVMGFIIFESILAQERRKFTKEIEHVGWFVYIELRLKITPH